MADTTKELQKKEAEIAKGTETTRAKKAYTPAVDILERKDDIILTADMPGVDENSVDINLEKNVLTIFGNVERELPEGYNLALREYNEGNYYRSFTLSDEVDREKIKAAVKNGVLKLILPKADIVKQRKIEVKAEA